jgi:hypothetical protein
MSPGQFSAFAKAIGEVEGIKPQHVALALSLAAATGPDGCAFISLGRLGRRCGMSVRNAGTYVRWLVEKQVMTVEKVAGRSNRYDLTSANSCLGVGKQLPRGRQTVADVPSKNPSYIPKRGASRPLGGGLRLSPDTNPTEKYIPPAGGMSLKEHMKRSGDDWRRAGGES